MRATTKVSGPAGQRPGRSAAEIEQAAAASELQSLHILDELLGGDPGVLSDVAAVGFRPDLPRERGGEAAEEIVVAEIVVLHATVRGIACRSF